MQATDARLCTRQSTLFQDGQWTRAKSRRSREKKIPWRWHCCLCWSWRQRTSPVLPLQLKLAPRAPAAATLLHQACRLLLELPPRAAAPATPLHLACPGRPPYTEWQRTSLSLALCRTWAASPCPATRQRQGTSQDGDYTLQTAARVPSSQGTHTRAHLPLRLLVLRAVRQPPREGRIYANVELQPGDTPRHPLMQK